MGFSLRRHTKVTAEMTVGLTPVGKKIADEMMERGPNFALLTSLAERSPRSVSELSHDTQIDISEVKARIKILSRQGYVRLTGLEE